MGGYDRWLGGELSNEEMARRATWVKKDQGAPFDATEFEVILKEMTDLPNDVLLAFTSKVGRVG